jgi:hypothetical protein
MVVAGKIRAARRSPLAVAGAVAAAYGVYVLALLTLGGHTAMQLAHVGRDFATSSSTSAAIDATADEAELTVGYDGQFALFIALDPAGAHEYLDEPQYRYSRIGYPIVARVLAAGHEPLIPYTLLLVNIVAVAVAAAAVGFLLRRRGASPWIALAFAFYPGIAFSVLHDLTEPLAYALVAVAILVGESRLRHRAHLAGAVFGLAVLTRESTLVFALAYAAAALVRHRRREAAWLAALATIPAALWMIFLAAWLGTAGLVEPYTGEGGGPVPFAGLVTAWPGLRIGEFSLLTVVVPGLVMLVAAVAAAARRGLSVEVVALIANVLAFVVFLPGHAWVEWHATGRITSGVVLAAVLAYPALRAVAPAPRAAFATSVGLWSVPAVLFAVSPTM